MSIRKRCTLASCMFAVTLAACQPTDAPSDAGSGAARAMASPVEAAVPRVPGGMVLQRAGLAGASAATSARQTYIVSSQSTYRGFRGVATWLDSHRDATGNRLALSVAPASKVERLAMLVHENEDRCGGFFAFDSRSAADDFIRTQATAQALAAAPVAYAIRHEGTVRSWLPQVSEPHIRGTIAHLSGYTNRYYAGNDGRAAALWIHDTWKALGTGRSDVRTELFTDCPGCATQPSVILTIQGTDMASEVVVLGGHLDSINANGGGSPSQLAPGADDNASGIAVLTETLRIAMASGWRPRRTVKFMGYAAEEVGLRGSKAIATAHRNAGENVVAVLQVDMTNYQSGAVADMRLISDYSNAELKQFFAILFDTYLAPLGHTRSQYACGYACSDHASWTAAGYPAAMMFEAGNVDGRYPYIHTTADTLASMGGSATHSVKFAQFSLAFLAELGNAREMHTGGPQPSWPAGGG